jgi:DedD protein
VNNQLKQRLVGAVVLVALAVIFIPMLLPGEGNLGGGISGSNIPPEPDFRFPPVPAAPKAPPVAAAPIVPLGDESAETAKSVPAIVPAKTVTIKAATKPPAPSISKTKPKPKAKPAPKPTPPPVAKAIPKKSTSGQVNAWVVQVGSFAARNNARALRDKLRKQGHASFVESINGTSGRVYRVRVGPELTKSAADSLRQQLEKEAGLKGLVQAYP